MNRFSGYVAIRNIPFTPALHAVHSRPDTAFLWICENADDNFLRPATCTWHMSWAYRIQLIIKGNIIAYCMLTDSP